MYIRGAKISTPYFIWSQKKSSFTWKGIEMNNIILKKNLFKPYKYAIISQHYKNFIVQL